MKNKEIITLKKYKENKKKKKIKEKTNQGSKKYDEFNLQKIALTLDKLFITVNTNKT